ncbi:MAG: class I SAM-dependent methyltransferase [Deltaproteobacteria bacterium]|nr:class I SAM-dependent methyltransferase [Deltaproteobacteria bacterium]
MPKDLAKESNLLSLVESWDLVAEGYTQDLDWAMTPFSLKAIEVANLTPESRVLDIACGPGTLTLKVAPYVRQVDALDFSKEMLSLLINSIKNKNITNIKIHQADAHHLPFKDQQFDAVFSMFGIMVFSDRHQAFSEALRVLKPGAKALIASWEFVESTFLSDLLKLMGASDLACEEKLHSLENVEDFYQEMTIAGFDQVEIQRHTVKLGAVDAKTLWDKMARATVSLAWLRKKIGEEEWQKQSLKALDYLENIFKGQSYVFPATALIGVGTKSS